MAALPYMQFYVADYLADTSHLNAAQHGAYLLLIMNYWQRGKPLKNDIERLSNVARMSIEEWEKNKDVLAEFFTITEEEWIHHRIERDLAKVKAKSDKARSSVQQRINKRSSNDERTIDRTIPYTDTDTDTDTDIYISSFLRAWEKYPALSKGSKSKAQDKFVVLARGDPSLPEKISLAIDQQHTEHILKKRYGIWCEEWKHFITWLNQRCWENEVNLNEEFWKHEASQRNAKSGNTATQSRNKPKSKTDLLWDVCGENALKGTALERREPKIINPDG